MSGSDCDSLQGLEDALERLNVSIRGYNRGMQDSLEEPQALEDASAQPQTLQAICERHVRGIDWSTGELLFSKGWILETDEHFPDIANLELRKRLNALEELRSFVPDHPYSIELYSRIADAYIDVGYPDLAVGVAYKALLLVDNLDDDGCEYYDPTCLSLAESISKESLISRCNALNERPDVQKLLFHPDHVEADDNGLATFPINEKEVQAWATDRYARRLYTVLAQCLCECGCYRSAADYCQRGLAMYPGDEALRATLDAVRTSVREHFKASPDDEIDIKEYPDQGMVRRECYPWNHHEPDRCSEESLAFLNAELAKVAPNLEVKATMLPALTGEAETSPQLGMFAKEDIAPGEIVLNESSLLTANNRLQDALCDACSSDIPGMNDPAFADVVACPECSVVFCNEFCSNLANEEYHPAVCDKGVEDIAKNAPRTEAANTLYTLLLLRSLAMAETQECHPLDNKYVKFIWGDYHIVDISDRWTSDAPFSSLPRTLPFSFQTNVVLPFTMLEMMDIDVFINPQYDVWVFNTLYAKFRGTASARLSGLAGSGPIRGPEVSAVHPNWCLANHSCDPNVTWNWSSRVKFRVLEERVQWRVGRTIGDENGAPERSERRTSPGLKKGQEVLSHYCDIELPVQQRREWAAGSLGGECCCDRCVTEAKMTE